MGGDARLDHRDLAAGGAEVIRANGEAVGEGARSESVEDVR
jgi:hypothetical protein